VACDRAPAGRAANSQSPVDDGRGPRWGPFRCFGPVSSLGTAAIFRSPEVGPAYCHTLGVPENLGPPRSRSVPVGIVWLQTGFFTTVRKVYLYENFPPPPPPGRPLGPNRNKAPPHSGVAFHSDQKIIVPRGTALGPQPSRPNGPLPNPPVRHVSNGPLLGILGRLSRRPVPVPPTGQSLPF